ncbi:MAG: VanZ family protein [Myxococcales bacterium]|nr:VanZ family protein [Myxococcales bacterium]
MSRDGTRLARALFGYVLLLTLLVTWAPFHFNRPPAIELHWRAPIGDVLINIVLFFGPGFLWRASGGRSLALTGMLGLAFSALIEAVQLLSPVRSTSVFDVAANGFGALLGALTHRALQARIDARLAGRLLLELPLSGLFYLLTLLLFVDGLAVAGQPERAPLLPLIALSGAALIVPLWRDRLHRVLSRGRVALLAALWSAVAALPALLVAPLWGLGSAAAVLVVVAVAASSSRVAQTAPERRFEWRALAFASLPFAGYLLALSAWPLSAPAPFRVRFGLADIAGRVRGDVGEWPELAHILVVLERAVAATVLGYGVAQAAGRRFGERPAALLGVVALLGALAAAAGEALRGVHPHYHASLVAGAVALACSLVGALIYRAQLAVTIAALRSAPDVPRSRPEAASGAAADR